MATLITGLPRTGTAWLANALARMELPALHEYMFECYAFEEYVDYMKLKSSIDVNSMGILYVNQLKEQIPDLKIIVLDRNPIEVYESLIKIGMPVSGYHRILAHYQNALNIADRVFEYPKYIQTMEGFRELFNEISSEHQFYYSVWARLAPMKVEKMMDSVKVREQWLKKRSHFPPFDSLSEK